MKDGHTFAIAAIVRPLGGKLSRLVAIKRVKVTTQKGETIDVNIIRSATLSWSNKQTESTGRTVQMISSQLPLLSDTQKSSKHFDMLRTSGWVEGIKISFKLYEKSIKNGKVEFPIPNDFLKNVWWVFKNTVEGDRVCTYRKPTDEEAENISKIRKSAEVGTSKKRKIEEGLLSEPEENLSDTPKKLDPVNVTKKKPKPVSVEKRQSISAGKSPIMNSNDSNGPTLHVTSVTESLMKEFQAEFQATANQQNVMLQELVSEHIAAFKTIETNMSGFNNLRINIKDTELIHTHQEGLIKR